MKIIFMGTPDFAVPSLKKLIEVYNVVSVLTQPDRPKGRGNKITMSAVKEESLKHNIPVYQPIKLKSDMELIEKIKSLNPDFIIVVAFGQLLPKEVLDIPRYGCINLHASLLPKYRGAAPINWAIINGEKVSGNTAMFMSEGLDTGDILLKQEVVINSYMTAGELHDELMIKGAELLVKTIEGLTKGTIIPVKQNHSESCYASMLNKDLGKICWEKSAEDIKNLVLGLNPWPVAYTSYFDKTMKIYDVEILDEQGTVSPGRILEVSSKGIKVSTGDNYILIKTIQFPGGKALTVADYIKGHNIEKGIMLT